MVTNVSTRDTEGGDDEVFTDSWVKTEDVFAPDVRDVAGDEAVAEHSVATLFTLAPSDVVSSKGITDSS